MGAGSPARRCRSCSPQLASADWRRASSGSAGASGRGREVMRRASRLESPNIRSRSQASPSATAAASSGPRRATSHGRDQAARGAPQRALDAVDVEPSGRGDVPQRAGRQALVRADQAKAGVLTPGSQAPSRPMGASRSSDQMLLTSHQPTGLVVVVRSTDGARTTPPTSTPTVAIASAGPVWRA